MCVEAMILLHAAVSSCGRIPPAHQLLPLPRKGILSTCTMGCLIDLAEHVPSHGSGTFTNPSPFGDLAFES